MPILSLHQATLQLLEYRPRKLTYYVLARQLNAKYPGIDITPDWLNRFATQLSRQPCVDKVQAVYEFLSSQSLSI